MERASRAHAFVNCPWLNLLLRATAMFFALVRVKIVVIRWNRLLEPAHVLRNKAIINGFVGSS